MGVLVKFIMQRRPDRNWLIEFICPHGVGHPLEASVMWIVGDRLDHDDPDFEDEVQAEMVHGCDGCCGDPDFPDMRSSLLRSHEIIRSLIERLIDVKADCSYRPVENS